MEFPCRDLIYHLCPGEDCDKVFFKLGHTMNKHVIKYHLKEERVLETIFPWTKQRCMLCCRQINLFPHFKGHMQLHVEHPQYFCYHQHCGQRFESVHELRSHESQHVPLRLQCMYPACETAFSDMSSLHDHEWRHYVPTPQKSDFELGPGKHKRHNDEAPWKQRVRVEELWMQSKNSQKEGISLREVTDDEWKTTNDLDLCNNEASVKAVNGYYEKTDLATLTPQQPCSKNEPEKGPINVKMPGENTIFTTDGEQNVDEPVIIEHPKTFKPADPSFKSVFKNLVRPPPSMYMTEKELSMRKRRNSGEMESPPVKKHPQTFKKQQLQSEKQETPQPKAEPEPETKIRHRCEKCLSFFASPEELEKHKSLNTCSALFGFDSDDES